MGAACQHAASVSQAIELADIFRKHGRDYVETHQVGPTQWKVVRAILQCRTAALGGHRESCRRCGYSRYR